MVYGNEMQPQHPMTSIPREMQITQNAPMHQLPVANQQSDIINLSYNQRDMQMPHPDLPQQMGLYPTIPQQNQQHNHALQSQQQQSIEQTEQQPIPTNINIQYNMDSVDANADANLHAENVNFNADADKNTNNNENAGEEIVPAQSENTPVTEEKKEDDGEASTNEDEDEEGDGEEDEEEDKSSEGKHIADEVKKEPEIDPNQCRVCKNTETLIDIFAIEEDMRICDIIMKMCSKIRIHERDFLPHMICISCLGRLRTAYQFTKDVVATDAELRAKLPRRKRARKANEGVVIIDCNEFTDSDNYEQNDDDDYQVSNEEEDVDDWISGSDSDSAKKVKIPKKRGRKPKSEKIKQELATTAKRLKRDIVFIEADNSDEEKVKKKEKCKECGKAFSNKTALRMHKQKAHMSRKAPTAEDAPFKCNVCSRAFKYSINLTSHMQMHKDSYACDECGRVFALKSDAKKHALNSHKCSLSYECNKCRRLYTSVKRYQKHRESCSDYTSSASKREKKMIKIKEEVPFAGRDLFKAVAPATTTYWSDSFSD
jgi:hypothetical protein